MTYAGEVSLIAQTETAQLIRARRLKDRYPFKIVRRADDTLLAQYQHKIEAIAEWVRRYQRRA